MHASVVTLRREAPDQLALLERLTAEAKARSVSPMDLTVLKRLANAWIRDPWQFEKKKLPRVCPMCSFKGTFVSVGWPSRWEARCPKCASRERHRLMYLWMLANGGNPFEGKRILHFAPEKAFRRLFEGHPAYETADWEQEGVTHRLDVTNLTLPNSSYDVVIAHHLLEHIDDDRKAMSELHRVLSKGGIAILSVPINGTRDETYENPSLQTREERFQHFVGHDHKRYYGLDFARRVQSVGFEVETFRTTPEAEVVFGLLRDEWIYIARKA
jgi:hypothetical protein